MSATSVAVNSPDLAVIADALSEYARRIRKYGNSGERWSAEERLEACKRLEDLILDSRAITVHMPVPPQRYRPMQPAGYCPETIERFKELASDAIEREVRVRKIDTPDVAKYLPSIRKGDMDRFLMGNGPTFGINKIIQVGEAIGLRFELSIKGAS